MSLHINRFIDRVRAAEHRGQKDLTMTMSEARDLQADLAKLLMSLHVITQATHTDVKTTVEIDGGSF